MNYQLSYDAEVSKKYVQNLSDDDLFENLYGSVEDGLLDFRGCGYEYDIILIRTKHNQFACKVSGEPPFKLAVLGNRDGYIVSYDKIVSIIDLHEMKLKYCNYKEHDIRDVYTLPNTEMLKIDEPGEFLQVLEYDKEHFFRVKCSFGWHQADEEGFHHSVYFFRIDEVKDSLIYCQIKDQLNNTYQTIHSLHSLKFLNRTDIEKQITKLK